MSKISFISVPVHPRACGDNGDRNTRHSLGFRFTPARAGDNDMNRGSAPTQTGSPPRVRGQLGHLLSPSARGPVHPRACGDNVAMPTKMTGASGSPPRVRGQRRHAVHRIGQRRFTPARAGTTGLCPCVLTSATVHPRACGDNGHRSLGSLRRYGSPPRVRGQRWRPVAGGPGRRFTPARAGTTHRQYHPTPLPTVHPRACGDNHLVAAGAKFDSGSPPRVRGQRNEERSAAVARRFTPARAGTTQSPCRPRQRATVYPRACGHNVLVGHRFDLDLGSPPRVRGQRYRPRRHCRLNRFTPARAGTT